MRLLASAADLIIGGTGLAVGVVGFSLTIWQLLRTRKSAVAAERAAERTQSSLQSNIMLVDISACLGTIEQIKTAIRSKRYEAALLRVTDLTSQLSQIRQLPDFSNSVKVKMQGIVSQLSVLRNTLEARDRDAKQTFNPVNANKKLSEISDCLTGWIGIYKYSINKGD